MSKNLNNFNFFKIIKKIKIIIKLIEFKNF
jgi:hypothetical protein